MYLVALLLVLYIMIVLVDFVVLNFILFFNALENCCSAIFQCKVYLQDLLFGNILKMYKINCHNYAKTVISVKWTSCPQIIFQLFS